MQARIENHELVSKILGPLSQNSESVLGYLLKMSFPGPVPSYSCGNRSGGLPRTLPEDTPLGGSGLGLDKYFPSHDGDWPLLIAVALRRKLKTSEAFNSPLK